jgi:hypothetical protein
MKHDNIKLDKITFDNGLVKVFFHYKKIEQSFTYEFNTNFPIDAEIQEFILAFVEFLIQEFGGFEETTLQTVAVQLMKLLKPNEFDDMAK